MEKYIYVIIFVVIVIPVSLYIILKPMFRQNKLLCGVVNYDTFMRKFVFRIELTREDFYSQLKMRNDNDSLDYYLSDDCSTISFIRYSKKYQYKIFVDEANDFIVLRLEQIPIVSKATYLINEFFINKFNAIPVEFEKYPF